MASSSPRRSTRVIAPARPSSRAQPARSSSSSSIVDERRRLRSAARAARGTAAPRRARRACAVRCPPVRRCPRRDRDLPMYLVIGTARGRRMSKIDQRRRKIAASTPACRWRRAKRCTIDASAAEPTTARHPRADAELDRRVLDRAGDAIPRAAATACMRVVRRHDRVARLRRIRLQRPCAPAARVVVRDQQQRVARDGRRATSSWSVPEPTTSTVDPSTRAAPLRSPGSDSTTTPRRGSNSSREHVAEDRVARRQLDPVTDDRRDAAAGRATPTTGCRASRHEHAQRAACGTRPARPGGTRGTGWPRPGRSPATRRAARRSGAGPAGRSPRGRRSPSTCRGWRTAAAASSTRWSRGSSRSGGRPMRVRRLTSDAESRRRRHRRARRAGEDEQLDDGERRQRVARQRDGTRARATTTTSTPRTRRPRRTATARAHARCARDELAVGVVVRLATSRRSRVPPPYVVGEVARATAPMRRPCPIGRCRIAMITRTRHATATIATSTRDDRRRGRAISSSNP